ncbi:HBL338Wp [Eremothecium sinecaudum]|uniref:HBL338Wp n=1 Tax=Eremothecium sinecaudum TaxID=45286 RepID=A0A109UW20_9SACH|nr:HBL338Wp [Eremothecium sinecaudum]AMD18564.1 HBL338Wp [Eremothecium sinecaudum]
MAAILNKKILMLHGYAQSQEIFRSKTGGLRKALEKLGYELYYPQGPLEIEHVDYGSGNDDNELAVNGKTDRHGWWRRDATGFFTIKQATLDYLHDYIIDKGPFEGVIGFSQGAALAGYLCTDVRGILGLTSDMQPDFKFLVNFSGFKLEPEIYAAKFKEPLKIPSLHVVGELDTIVLQERTMALYDACHVDSRTLLKHTGGHFVPNSKNFVAKVTNWLKCMNAEPSSVPKTVVPKTTSRSGPQSDLLDIMASLDIK